MGYRFMETKKIKKYTTCIIQKCSTSDDICRRVGKCDMVEAEKEYAVESLKSHLGEQRHDFFNLLQVLYGYTQLKKSDKVLEHIKHYCRQMENIGRLYNCKCIKLADLLYNKDKEAGSVDLNFEVNIDISFEPVVRMLEDERVLHALDYAISGFFYVLDDKGYKNAHIIYNLKENTDGFQMEIYCKELRESQLDPISFTIPMQAMYWKKTARSIMSFDRITKYCEDTGLGGKMLEAEAAYVLSIYKI
jgi:hypothetical protein